MRNLSVLIGVAVVLVGLPGCTGPVGTWKLTELVPADAARHFGVQAVTFGGDGTYRLSVVRAGRPTQLTGRYAFDKEKELVTFTDAAGKVVQYRVATCDSCGYMYLSNPTGKEEWRAKFTRR
ncbi:MAG: hypothetical protein KA383_00380 [Phycisphaerae bacterium]|nr:hypothetical protein [Phycisphaerae bacterium]